MTTEPSDLARLEAEPIDDQDLATLGLLRELYELGDPVPDSLVERVKFAITLDDLEAEVARLQRESVPELVSRTDEVLRARSVTFTSETLTTMVTLTPTDSGLVRIDGWVTPGAGVDVELRVGDATHHVIADEDGRFVFEGVARGLAQLVMRQTGDDGARHPVITPAIEL